MIYDDCTLEELRACMKQNSDQQDELERSIERLHTGEDDSLRMLQEGRKAVELLHTGWTGDNAENYITKALETNEMFKKQYLQAFSQEEERLQNELRRLQLEAQSISDAMLNKNTRSDLWEE